MTEVQAPSRSEQAAAQALAARVASRICHDLVSPLGAIGNGLELLHLSGLEPSPEADLIAQSVESAGARIRFFRMAFGPAGDESVGASEIATTLRGLEKGSRLALDWTPEGETPRRDAKALFLLLACLESAMPLGGRIHLGRDEPGWSARAESPRLRVDPAVWSSLGPDRSPPPDSAALVQFALLPLALTAAGWHLDLAFEPEAIAARLVPASAP